VNGEQTTIRPGKTWYVIAAALLAVGVVAMPIWLVTNVVEVFSTAERFVAPGAKTFTLTEAGKYVLWHEAKTDFEGKHYSSPPALPDGVTIKVVQEETGQELPLEKALNASESTPSHESHSICTFTIDSAGDYGVTVTDLDSPRVLKVRRSVLDAMGWDIAQGIVFFLVCAIAGIAIIVVVTSRRSKAKREIQAGGPAGEGPAQGHGVPMH